MRYPTQDRSAPERCERERLLLRRECEGASTDRGCLTPVSLTCSGTREAPVRCPSHWRLRHLPAAPVCGSCRMRGRESRGESLRDSLPMQRLESWGSRGRLNSSRGTRETCRQHRCWQVRGTMRGLEETPCGHPAPFSGCMRLAAERRTTGASSAGAGTPMGSSGTATHLVAASAGTVVPERDRPALAMLGGGFAAVGVVDGTGR